MSRRHTLRLTLQELRVLWLAVDGLADAGSGCYVEDSEQEILEECSDRLCILYNKARKREDES